MKTLFYKLIALLFFVSFYFSAAAQSVPDTMRVSVGLEGGLPIYNTDLYSHILGASLRIDYPLTRKTYITATAGYNIAFVSSNAPKAILNVNNADMKTIPLKIGIKHFLIRHFYVLGEAGTTLLANKNDVYAPVSYAFTWSPQIGMLFFLKRHTYIDAGIRYEGVSSFYNDKQNFSFWAAHVAYAFNL